jgi:hypothetical protein
MNWNIGLWAQGNLRFVEFYILVSVPRVQGITDRTRPESRGLRPESKSGSRGRAQSPGDCAQSPGDKMAAVARPIREAFLVQLYGKRSNGGSVQ